MLLLPAVRGDGPETIADQIKAVIAEYDKASSEYLQAAKIAKTKQERKEALSKRPSARAYAGKLRVLAEKEPKDPASGQACAWIIANAGSSKEARSALDLLIAHHAKNSGIAAAILRLATNPDVRIEKFLHDIISENPSKNLKGLATFALAKRYVHESERGEGKLTQDQLDALNQKAQKLFEVVQRDYAEVKTPPGTLGQFTKGELFALAHLQVGKTAPDIVGEDLDGNEFALSDYRGKVVLLDFWGHWVPPCWMMFPHERALVRRLAGAPFVLIGVNSDKDKDSIRKQNQKHEISWRSFWDGPEGWRGPISKEWRIRGWPTLYLIDHEGVIRRKWLASPSPQALNDAVDELVAKVPKK